MTNISYSEGTTPAITYAYANDAAGRRTSVANTGSAFGQAATNLWSYNAKSEVTGQTRRAGSDLTNLGSEIASGGFAYDFDNIGNRTTSTSGSFAATYTANALNQYSAIASTVPAKTLTPTYDADGNELFDGTWHYKWDGENRLTSALNYSGTPSEGSKRLTFAYDYQSRRVRKTVETYASGEWATTSDAKYLYNGWNLVCEYDATTLTSGNPTLTATYTWGLDIAEQNDASRSGSAEPGSAEPGSAAGGVGGLLAVNRITTADATVVPVGVYAPIYDGNGNVTGLINTSGVSVSHTEYGPFGEVVSATGAASGSCPYGFSTKYTDEDTALCYYGYRYYDSEWGRWLSRDPVGERTGVNLYTIMNNEPINLIDIVGLCTKKCMVAYGPEISYTGYTDRMNHAEHRFSIFVQFVSYGVKDAAGNISEPSLCDFQQLISGHLIIDDKVYGLVSRGSGKKSAMISMLMMVIPRQKILIQAI